MEKTCKVLLVAFATYGIWEMYKRYNPSAVRDMKMCLNKATKKVSNEIENMM